MVLTASTIAFQAIGTGSNPVTRSIKKKADQGPLLVDPWGKKLRGIGQHLYRQVFFELVQFIKRKSEIMWLFPSRHQMVKVFFLYLKLNKLIKKLMTHLELLVQSTCSPLESKELLEK